jgi:hypothetical protein
MLVHMAKTKKSKTARSRTTEWQIGQPLMFPAGNVRGNIERVASEALQEGLSGPFKSRRKKSKKK